MLYYLSVGDVKKATASARAACEPKIEPLFESKMYVKMVVLVMG